ncbi:MAG: carbohydrate ABC transporter permease [Bifidobacteriaceae bacterium]|jgi:alpha-glucoside transport system permease protein|nr:carbohydrate ABC transporter permease [Bifidobacteriaceae bacterium]
MSGIQAAPAAVTAGSGRAGAGRGDGIGGGNRGLGGRAARAKRNLTSPWASGIAIGIGLLWSVPTFGLLVTSFRGSVKEIQSTGWWQALSPSNWSGFSLDHYRTVLSGSGTANLADYFINSIVVTLPAVVIPIFLALLAAYAFAWIPFRGSNLLFVGIFALQVVPIQVAMVPLLTQYVNLGLNASFWVLWLSHAMFGLPLAIFLLHNFMKDIPSSLVEAARVDGAGHVTIFFRVVLPLMVPAIASFAIFQFLWVWNDLLVALAFGGNTPDLAPITARLSDMAGSLGAKWHLLSAGAFVSMIVPMVVFLALQRYFVRGLLAGSVKG